MTNSLCAPSDIHTVLLYVMLFSLCMCNEFLCPKVHDAALIF